MSEKIKEIVEEEIEDKRGHLTIQDFMNDMRLLDEQLKDKNVAKPVFDFGSSVVTNYLLWLILGEMMMLNDVMEED